MEAFPNIKFLASDYTTTLYLYFIDNLNEVKIFLAKTLVYENVNEYTLTLQVRNSPDLVAEAQLIIKVKDVNNLVSVKIHLSVKRECKGNRLNNPALVIN